MVRTLTFAALALALNPVVTPRAALAQFGGMGGMGGFGMDAGPPSMSTMRPYKVRAETNGGRSVAGKLNMASVVVVCDLGRYEIKPEKVNEVRFSPLPADQPLIVSQYGTPIPGVVVTRSGEEIPGKVLIPRWVVETDLGMLTLMPGTLKTLAITGEVKGQETSGSGPQQGKPEGNGNPARPEGGPQVNPSQGSSKPAAPNASKPAK